MNGTLFFRANDGTNGDELWQSDGTGRRHHPRQGYPAQAAVIDPLLTNVNGTLVFKADDDTYGEELWQSDGTDSGTVLVKDIRPGDCSRIYTT